MHRQEDYILARERECRGERNKERGVEREGLRLDERTDRQKEELQK